MVFVAQGSDLDLEKLKVVYPAEISGINPGIGINWNPIQMKNGFY